MLATPGFHHLHLNSVDPDAAIDFYVRQFPSTSKTTWNGFPALKSPTNVLILFSKVAAPPPTSPQTAIWHFGWHVVDSRKSLETYKARPDVKHFPLYTSDEGGTRADQQRHLAGRRRARADARGNRGSEGQERAARARARLRLSARARRRHRRVSRQLPGRAHEPRAHVPGPSVLRRALVPQAPRRAAGRGPQQRGIR